MNPEADMNKIHEIVDGVIQQTSEQASLVRAHEVLAEVDVAQSALAEPFLPQPSGQPEVALDIIDRLDHSDQVEIADPRALRRAAIVKAAARQAAERERSRSRVPLVRFFPVPLPDYLQDSLYDPRDDEPSDD